LLTTAGADVTRSREAGAALPRLAKTKNKNVINITIFFLTHLIGIFWKSVREKFTQRLKY
jgi:hypothetical protein